MLYSYIYEYWTLNYEQTDGKLQKNTLEDTVQGMDKDNIKTFCYYHGHQFWMAVYYSPKAGCMVPDKF